MPENPEIPCYFCKKPTKWRYSPDMDIEGMSICRSDECFLKLWAWLDEKMAKRPKPKMTL